MKDSLKGGRYQRYKHTRYEYDTFERVISPWESHVSYKSPCVMTIHFSVITVPYLPNPYDTYLLMDVPTRVPAHSPSLHFYQSNFDEKPIHFLIGICHHWLPLRFPLPSSLFHHPSSLGIIVHLVSCWTILACKPATANRADKITFAEHLCPMTSQI